MFTTFQPLVQRTINSYLELLHIYRLLCRHKRLEIDLLKLTLNSILNPNF